MKEQGHPTLTLTLRRKAEPEGQRAVNNSEPDSAGPGRVTRKKTVVVNTTPAWKVRKQAQEREAMRAARRKPAPEPVYRKVMPLADALALLERCWPALVTDGQPQLLATHHHSHIQLQLAPLCRFTALKQLFFCENAIFDKSMLYRLKSGKIKIN